MDNAKPGTWGCIYSYHSIAPIVSDASFRLVTLKPSPTQRTTVPVEDVLSDATETQIDTVTGDLMAAVTFKPSQFCDAESLTADWRPSQPLFLKSVSVPTARRWRTPSRETVRNVPAANNAFLRLLEKQQQGHVITVAGIPAQDSPADLPSRSTISQQ